MIFLLLFVCMFLYEGSLCRGLLSGKVFSSIVMLLGLCIVLVGVVVFGVVLVVGVVNVIGVSNEVEKVSVVIVVVCCV